MTHLILSAIEIASIKTALNPTAQSLSSLNAKRFSGNTIDLAKVVIWEGNLNRVEYGDIPAFAQFLADNAQKAVESDSSNVYPGVFEGFIKDGLFHVTDGCRRLVAATYAVKNLNLTRSQEDKLSVIPVRLVDSTDTARLYASQLTSESMNKSPYECAIIVSKIMECTNSATGKRYTQSDAAKLVNRDDATITGYLQFLNHASEELITAVKEGEITYSEAISEVKSDIKVKKESAKSSGKAIMGQKTPKPTKVNSAKVFSDICETMLVDTFAQPFADASGQRVSLEMSKEQYDEWIAHLNAYISSK